MSVDIIYFDYWSRGIRHFSQIDKIVKESGKTSLLIHLGSQRGEPIIKNQIIEGVNCKDIAFYKNDLVTMLKKEKPKIVLLLNNQTEDKIIVRACRNLGILTICMMHGILVPSKDFKHFGTTIDKAFNLVDRLKRLKKYIILFYQYLKASSIFGLFGIFDFEIYKYFWNHALAPGSNMTGRWRYKDSCANIALVYSKEDKNIFVKNHGYQAESVKIVGNYNLDELYYINEKVLNLKKKSNPNKYVLYIENGFSDPKYPIPGWTEERVADEVIKLSNLCQKFNYKLILKLHPSSDYLKLPRLISSHNNITQINNCNLSELIAESDFVIGQSSSVLIMALVIGKPLGILDIEPLKLTFKTFLDLKMGTHIKTLDNFEKFLKDKKKFAIYSNEFIGPFDGKAVERISEIIISYFENLKI